MSSKLLKRVSLQQKIEAARSADASAYLLELLAKETDEQVRRAVAENPRTDGATLALLAKDDAEEVRYAALRHPNLPYTSMLEVVKSNNKKTKEKLILCQRQPLPSDVLLRELIETSPPCATYLAKLPHLPLSLQKKILRSAIRLETLVALATNPTLAPNIALALLSHREQKVLDALAKNPSVSKDVKEKAQERLEQMAGLKRRQKRRQKGQKPPLWNPLWFWFKKPALPTSTLDNWADIAAAGHLSLPQQQQLLQLAPPPVLAKLAQNPYLHSSLQEPLSRHPASSVRLALTQQTRLTTDAFLRLGQDAHPDIATAIARHGNLPKLTPAQWQTFFRQLPPHVLQQWAARADALPLEVLLCLYEQGDTSVRRQLAQRQDLTNELKDALAQDDAELVRIALALNETLTDKQWKVLAQDKSPRVKSALLSNPKLPPALVVEVARQTSLAGINPLLLQIAADQRTPQNVLVAIYEHGPKEGAALLHQALARNPNLPAPLLAQLAHSPFPEVRQALLEHPMATPGVWQEAIKGIEADSLQGLKKEMMTTLSRQREVEISTALERH